MDEKKVANEKKNIWQKMSYIQGLNITINKDKQAHGYAYGTLDQIMYKLNPILHENGLLVYHQVNYDQEEKCSYLRTIVKNVDFPTETIESVTYLDGSIVLPGQNKVMVIGSLITYYRRYHVTSIFGLTTETDTDAGGAIKLGKTATGGRSVEAAGGGEKAVDFTGIFQNMIAKAKPKDIVEKQLSLYKGKMSEEQVKIITKLIEEYNG